MEESSEPPHWGSPSLLTSDPLAGFSSEAGLLPPGDDSDSFFSSQDGDLAGLPNFFSSPPPSRALPSYRHSSGGSPPPSLLWAPASEPASHSRSVAVRQVFGSPGLLSNLQLLDGPAGPSLGSPFAPPAVPSGWSSSPFSVPPLHSSHTPASLYAPATVFSSSKDGYSPPLREGGESPQLQEALKAERLSPAGGAGLSSSSSSSFLNLTPATGGVYTTPSHSSSHMLNPYTSYVGGAGDFGSAGFYSNPGPWINSPYSAKLHSKMRISTPGEDHSHVKEQCRQNVT